MISYVNPVTGEYAVLEAVNCTSITGFQIGAEASEHADNDFDYPLGLASFHILCPNDGDTATIRQYFYGVEGSEAYSVRKWMPDGSYREFPDYQLLGMPVEGNGIVFLVEYQITDGGEFDDDGTVNGIIVDPSGPALPTGNNSDPSNSAGNNSPLSNTGQTLVLIYAVAGLLIVGLIGFKLVTKLKKPSKK